MAKRDWTTKNPGPAVYCPDGKYRYRLERILGDGPNAAFIMVNPSTATESEDDQTILMVQTVCKRFGIGRAIIGNAFACREPDVAKLAQVVDPTGPDNDIHLRQIAEDADQIIVAWGSPSKLLPNMRSRLKDVVNILNEAGKPLYCLQHLAGNHPRHPQILMHDTPLPLWQCPL